MVEARDPLIVVCGVFRTTFGEERFGGRTDA
jgi:hypothetical protein